MSLAARSTLPTLVVLAALATRSIAQPVAAREAPAGGASPAYGMQLEGFAYPWPVAQHHFRSQGQPLEMAYMDVKPARPNGRSAVLLHGKNFCGATWQGTITALVDAGYRVIAPDQIGFCKSSKPAQYQFSFQQLAGNTTPCSNRLASPRHHHRPFDRRDARHTLRADVSRPTSSDWCWWTRSGSRTGRRRACPGRA